MSDLLELVSGVLTLAPVADVPTSRQAFIWQQGRAFSFDAAVVARYGTAFAQGVQSAGVRRNPCHASNCVPRRYGRMLSVPGSTPINCMKSANMSVATTDAAELRVIVETSSPNAAYHSM